jgi:hypothetical protein
LVYPDSYLWLESTVQEKLIWLLII